MSQLGFTAPSCSQPAGCFLTVNNYRSEEEEGGVSPFAFSPVLKYSQPAETEHHVLADADSTAGGAEDPGSTGCFQGEQGISRLRPSSLGGTPRKPEA